jgi:Fatty acid hydroxylase superfamily
MATFALWSGAGFGLGIIFSSFFEWLLHRFLMHKPLWRLRYPFERHALIHHRIFRADETYHLQNKEDLRTIPMAWWNGPVLISACAVPFVVAAMIWGNWGLVCGAVISFVGYYSAYEYMHWCMHLPKRRRLEKSWLFYRLNGHHLLHHRYMNRNFNVVLPLADLVLGTLLRRSPVLFKQATGTGIPNVQPRNRVPHAEAVVK